MIHRDPLIRQAYCHYMTEAKFGRESENRTQTTGFQNRVTANVFIPYCSLPIFISTRVGIARYLKCWLRDRDLNTEFMAYEASEECLPSLPAKLVLMVRVELTIPKALVSKTSAYSSSAT